MTVLTRRWSSLDETARRKLLSRSETDIDAVTEDVAALIARVREGGDAVLRELGARFDGAPADAPILVPEKHFDEAEKRIGTPIKKALEFAVENVQAFHRGQVAEEMIWREVRTGVFAGERITPIASVGIYVPRGRGSFPSMLYMLAVPAALAGVGRICLASPPGPDGRVDDACLVTARMCGIQEVYTVGGAQAWAALAYGTETVRPVVKAVGPGSRYVAAAKRILAEVFDCGLPAGPSESMILADGSPDPRTVALDLMVEAEHGSDSAALLVTPSEELARAVEQHLETLIPELPDPRRGYVADVVGGGYGGILLVEDIEEGAEIVNSYAPEHLQIRTADPFDTLSRITDAGEILLGENVPFSAANYAVGVNAVLPTGGRARTWSGVSVRDFVKSSAVVYSTKSGLDALKEPAAVLADYEDFPAHRRALTDR